MWDTPVCPSLMLGFPVLQMVLHGAIVREKVWSSDFLCFKLCFKVKSDSQILMKHCMRQPCCFNPCLTEIRQSDFSFMMLHPMSHWNPRIRLFLWQMLHEAPFEAQDIRASDFFSLISGHSLSERITPAHSPPLPGRAYEGEKWSARLKNRLTAPPWIQGSAKRCFLFSSWFLVLCLAVVKQTATPFRRSL